MRWLATVSPLSLRCHREGTWCIRRFTTASAAVAGAFVPFLIFQCLGHLAPLPTSPPPCAALSWAGGTLHRTNNIYSCWESAKGIFQTACFKIGIPKWNCLGPLFEHGDSHVKLTALSRNPSLDWASYFHSRISPAPSASTWRGMNVTELQKYNKQIPPNVVPWTPHSILGSAT